MPALTEGRRLPRMLLACCVSSKQERLVTMNRPSRSQVLSYLFVAWIGLVYVLYFWQFRQLIGRAWQVLLRLF